MCFQFERQMPGDMNFPHSRCSLTPFNIAPLTTSSPRRFSLGKRMRGEAGKSCDRQIKCEYFDPIYCWLCFGSGLAPLFKQVRFVTRENWFYSRDTWNLSNFVRETRPWIPFATLKKFFNYTVYWTRSSSISTITQFYCLWSVLWLYIDMFFS